jgi:hypothetical protein
VNGTLIRDPGFRFSPGDYIELERIQILRFRHFFSPHLYRNDVRKRTKGRYTASLYSSNLRCYGGLRSMIFTGCPKESDLRRSNRIQGRLFR